jgi:hypothetical protein
MTAAVSTRSASMPHGRVQKCNTFVDQDGHQTFAADDKD